MNLFEKLVEIRKEIDVFKKDTEGYGYNYVSGSQVLSKIQKKMNELGVLLYPNIGEVEQDTYDYQVYDKQSKQMRDKTDFVIKGDMTYVWQNAEEPSETLEIPWKLFGQQDDISKAYGSGLTYSERYFLLKFFNAPTDEDDPDSRPTNNRGRGQSKASDKQLDFINNLLKRNENEKYTKEDLYKALKKRMNTDVEMENWTSQQASQAIKILQGDNK